MKLLGVTIRVRGDKTGMISYEDLEAAIRPNTKMLLKKSKNFLHQNPS